MKKISLLPVFFNFSISIFLLWTLGTWQLNKNFTVTKNNNKFDYNKLNIKDISDLSGDLDNLTYAIIKKKW